MATGPSVLAACCAVCSRASALQSCLYICIAVWGYLCIKTLKPLTRRPAPQVKGRRLDTNGGIRTRARAREQAEQWHMVPAPARILALMADTLLEAREGAAPLRKTLGACTRNPQAAVCMVCPGPHGDPAAGCARGCGAPS